MTWEEVRDNDETLEDTTVLSPREIRTNARHWRGGTKFVGGESCKEEVKEAKTDEILRKGTDVYVSFKGEKDQNAKLSFNLSLGVYTGVFQLWKFPPKQWITEKDLQNSNIFVLMK